MTTPTPANYHAHATAAPSTGGVAPLGRRRLYRSWDIMHRLRTLKRAHRRHQPLTPTLKSYTTVAVRRILKIMQDFSAAQLALSPREHDAILHDVLSQYKSRVGYRQEPHCTALAIAGYVSPLFSLIPFARILHDPEKECQGR